MNTKHVTAWGRCAVARLEWHTTVINLYYCKSKTRAILRYKRRHTEWCQCELSSLSTPSHPLLNGWISFLTLKFPPPPRQTRFSISHHASGTSRNFFVFSRHFPYPVSLSASPSSLSGRLRVLLQVIVRVGRLWARSTSGVTQWLMSSAGERENASRSCESSTAHATWRIAPVQETWKYCPIVPLALLPQQLLPFARGLCDGAWGVKTPGIALSSPCPFFLTWNLPRRRERFGEKWR